MNIILFKDGDFIDSTHAVVTDRRLKHLISVNRVQIKDQLLCGRFNGKMGHGEVTNITKTTVEFYIPKFVQDPPKSLPIALVLALPRPKMVRRIIESVTSLGIKDIYLINSWRVEKSFWQSPVLEKQSLAHHMILGLEQCRDTVMPKIHLERLFTPFVRERLPQIDKDSIKLVAHPSGRSPLPVLSESRATLVIGPEGGFVKREIQTFEELGYTVCHVGPRILRVETAVTAIVSRLTT